MTAGHEFVGEIVEAGSNVHDFKPGDIVSGEGHIVCGRCRNCLAGRRHLCAGTKGLGVNRNGAFAEYVAIPMTNVWHCSPNIPREIYAYFDPLGNAVHTALSFDLLGEDVLITVLIGMMAAAIANTHAWHAVVTVIMIAGLISQENGRDTDAQRETRKPGTFEALGMQKVSDVA